MATKYLCKANILISGKLYEAGNIYEFSADPGTSFAATTDPKTGNLSLSRDMDGTLYFPNTNWDDLRFPATGINPPGAASDPGLDATDGCWNFSKSAQNILAGVCQMPHSWKLGSPVEVHIHWEIPADSDGGVTWRFEYKYADLEGTFQTNYIALADVDGFGKQLRSGATHHK